MKKWMTKDVISSVVLLLFGVWWKWGAGLIAARDFDNGLSADYMPKLLGYCLLVLSAILLVQSLIKAYRQSEATDDKQQIKKNPWIAVGLLASLFAYCFIFKIVGFVISTFLFLFGSMSYLCRPTGENQKVSVRYFVKYCLIAGILTGILYLVFGIGFKINLPTIFL